MLRIVPGVEERQGDDAIRTDRDLGLDVLCARRRIIINADLLAPGAAQVLGGGQQHLCGASGEIAPREIQLTALRIAREGWQGVVAILFMGQGRGKTRRIVALRNGASPHLIACNYDPPYCLHKTSKGILMLPRNTACKMFLVVLICASWALKNHECIIPVAWVDP